MSDNDEEELRQALDQYTNAIRAERRAVDQGDSAEVDHGDSTMSDHGIENFSVRATLRH